jgi:polyisoprenoid-binding protein YceI
MAANTKWAIDAGHSEIRFKVKHLAIANVSGVFKSFRGTAESNSDENFENTKVYFEIDTQSLDTNNADRDGHLRSNLFLDADNFPKITFSGILQKKDDEFALTGDLTILQTTKPVFFQVEYTGSGTGRFNDRRAGFEVNGKINRKDFGLNFHLLNDAGNMVVGEEIKIGCDIELIRQGNI